MKLKIKSSARIKKRYLIVECKSDEDVFNAIREFGGISLWTRATPQKVNLIKNKNLKVFSVSRECLDDVRASFEVFKNEIRILKVAGTLESVGS